MSDEHKTQTQAPAVSEVKLSPTGVRLLEMSVAEFKRVTGPATAEHMENIRLLVQEHGGTPPENCALVRAFPKKDGTYLGWPAPAPETPK